MSNDDVIFREVDEELRRERMHSLWRRFGPYVIGAAIAVVLVVAVNEGWSWYRNNNAAQASDQFYAALKLSDGGDLAGAEAALDKLAAQGGGYATLARFKNASLLDKQGKQPEAVAAYDQIAADESNVRLRELALVMAADVLVDSGSLADVQSRVSAQVSTDNPMRNAAREAIGLAQYKAKDYDGARKTFTDIQSDPLAPQELLSRIQLYLGQITSEIGAPADANAAPADATPPANDAAAPAATPTPDAATPPSDTTAPADATPAPADDQPVTPAAPAVDSNMMQMMAPSPATTTPPDAAAVPPAPAIDQPQPPADAAGTVVTPSVDATTPPPATDTTTAPADQPLGGDSMMQMMAPPPATPSVPAGDQPSADLPATTDADTVPSAATPPAPQPPAPAAGN